MHICTMASKNINIEIKVYEKMKRMKRAGESFSQFLLRMLKSSEVGLEDSFGMLRGEPLDYNEVKRARADRKFTL